MTNAQIVSQWKAQNNIPDIIPFMTYAEWKASGRQVKKGEHGIQLNLWKHLENKKSKDKDGKIIEGDGYIMKKCTLFHIGQTEEIKA